MFFPEIEPYKSDFLKVSETHELYYELLGNKDGKPVIFLHGGPGGGATKDDRRWFNPETYHIVLLDQRGAGRSKPPACLEENTTWDLVNDIEVLRKHLAIERWLVFGGSWGSTLSLAYAQTHPERVKGLILRGIFTLRKNELDFFYQSGTSFLSVIPISGTLLMPETYHSFPEAWDEYLEPIPEDERGDMVKAYHSRLNSDDEKTRVTAAKAWSKWEMTTSRLFVDPGYLARAAEDDWANAFARIENHYFINEGFMRQGQLLEKQSIDKIRHIPCIVVQGRYDVVCPATTAYALKKAWPEIDLQIVPDAGHSSVEPGILKRLIEVSPVIDGWREAHGSNYIPRRLRSSLSSSVDVILELDDLQSPFVN